MLSVQDSECCGEPGLRTRVHDSGVRVFVAESVRSAELRSVRVIITRVRSRVSVVSVSSGDNSKHHNIRTCGAEKNHQEEICNKSNDHVMSVMICH